MRVDPEFLRAYAALLLSRAGLDPAYARIVAEVLVEGDLMGHETHGVALLPSYLKEIRAGRMTLSGAPERTSSGASIETWDGRWLPGPVLVRDALTAACARAAETGMGGVTIARSQHIACLAAYLLPVTEAGFAAIIASSSPTTQSVAPFGALQGVYSPNPLAAGWPTQGETVIFDISMSITTNGMVKAKQAEGVPMRGRWLTDAHGQATDDPNVIGQGGALMPVGGQDHGHKGFALGLLVEMLTSGLAGFGRADVPDRWGAAVTVLAFDPARFAGADAFRRQTEGIVAACRDAEVANGAPPVRIPGQNALRQRAEQMQHGVELAQPLVDDLKALDPDIRFPDPRSVADPALAAHSHPQRL
jgi:LDH2 family malate/lactate/ureidoglycolate dehydrogenase